MFGIKPLKTLMALAVLFLLFLMTKVDPKATTTVVKTVQEPTTKQEAIKLPQAQDGVTVLNHLFHEKIHDTAMKCQYKKAKQRFFIACKDGNVIKDNYWEFSLYKKRMRLLARSQSALYVMQKYEFKELRSDKQTSHPKVEKALVAFFE